MSGHNSGGLARGATPDWKCAVAALLRSAEWSSRQSPTPDEAERRGSAVATGERELEGEGDGRRARQTGEAVRPHAHMAVRPRSQRRCRGGDWRARDGESGDWQM
ncbi:hypothetical protein Syun_004889 [Stephania yunnanensis]|uniref:Uncharacterized protein n=1 Tax=Stephania yunnanensis TaxID=152371 RepID=A0AAP0Q187_9MAGN